ncbi:MAG TPA: GAF domain-containing protein [Steroidobacteraceae bacterium]|nr:GAF domain-containing protein [Steroidobacteraceae bacterium]
MSQHAKVTMLDAGNSSRERRTAIPLSELAAANRQRDALYLLSEQLHAAESLDEIHLAAMYSIEAALACERSAILLFDDAGVMRFVATHGLSAGYQDAVTGHSPWSKGERAAAPITIPDVEHSDLHEPLKSVVLGEDIRAIAFIPLVIEGTLIGKFMAYFREPYAFTKDDLAVSLVIARQLAFSLRRYRTDQRLRQRESQLADELEATRMLQQLSIEMAHEADIEGFYDKLIAAARNIMRSDIATMQQFFPYLGARGELKLLGHRGLTEEAARFFSWVRADSSCTCGVAIRSRKRVIAADVENESFMAGTADRAQLLQAGIRAAQTTPLISRGGELVGMISTHWKTPHQPSDRDLRLIDILARLAADLIERKNRDEESRRSEERLRALNQLLTDVPWQARGDGAFAVLQPAWENYTGQSWDAHAGHGWFNAIHPEDRAAVQAFWGAACFEAHAYEYPARLWNARAREYRACVIRATPIRNDDGSLREWVGACTERDLAPAAK